ncbi:hypothetical protein OC25_23220 [Pedobacter kyungheensis]|uniref:PLAT domain-containing protein n=1 Tax=Pedobacter kyungheensis TaxID=1069985 RepID=A0A0C1DAS6_9SPHI|nr:hypothetical protein [Pedobacter kyungheensis]KIA91055.1 hypothetical protein OC25_23220 [Pedobacter kyungheensis]
MKLIQTKLNIGIILAILFTLTSCSKKDDNVDGGNIGDKVKKAKFTVTVTGGTAKNLSIMVGGANTSGSTSTWKVNGTVMNDAVVMLESGDFPGTAAKTYTFELQQPANNVSLNINATSNNSSTYKIYYKTEINDVTKDEATVDITSAKTFTKPLRYTE